MNFCLTLECGGGPWRQSGVAEKWRSGRGRPRSGITDCAERRAFVHEIIINSDGVSLEIRSPVEF
jgi:hypothetical protein